MVHWYYHVVRVSGLGLNSAISAGLKFSGGKPPVPQPRSDHSTIPIQPR